VIATRPSRNPVFLRSWTLKKKSRPTLDEWRQGNGYVMAHVPAVVRSRRRAFDCTTVGVESFGWSLGVTSRWNCRGFCGGVVSVAASGSPTIRPFALPCKRFTKKPVLEKANEYLGTNHSYGETVKHEGMPIMYDDRVEATKRQPVGLAPSTVWRWLSLLGEMRGTLRTATKRIRGKEPDFLVHREACTVPARK